MKHGAGGGAIVVKDHKPDTPSAAEANGKALTAAHVEVGGVGLLHVLAVVAAAVRVAAATSPVVTVACTTLTSVALLIAVVLVKFPGCLTQYFSHMTIILRICSCCLHRSLLTTAWAG
jgi:hypothetical protein